MKREKQGIYWLYVAETRAKYNDFRCGEHSEQKVIENFKSETKIKDAADLREIVYDAMDFVASYDQRWINPKAGSLPKNEWRGLK